MAFSLPLGKEFACESYADKLKNKVRKQYPGINLVSVPGLVFELGEKSNLVVGMGKLNPCTSYIESQSSCFG